LTLKKPWLNSYDQEVPKSISYPEIPLFQFLEDAASQFPENPCTTYKDEQITYQVMAELVEALKNGLVNLGIKKGDRVGVILGNTPQFVLSFYGVLKAGGVVVACNPNYKAKEMMYQLQNSGCRFVIASSEQYGLLEDMQNEIQFRAVLLTDLGDYKYFSSILSETGRQFENMKPGYYALLDMLQNNARGGTVSRNVSSSDPAIFQYSGGTTGIPKAAIGLHSNLVANTLQFQSWLHGVEKGKEVVLAAIPLYHVYGMVIAMSMGIALGANLVLIPDPRDVGSILRGIEQYQATLFPGVPTMYQAINRHQEVKAGKFNLRSIKACICGSAPLLPDVKVQFENLTGGKLLEGYGLSEAPTATHCNPYSGENRVGSIGLPLPDVECRIVSIQDEKKVLSINEPGELIIRGPQIMQGYHEMPSETELTLRDGWLFTGDIAKMDADGYFYLVDRKKDVIKASGFQVWPREVEEVIAENPNVSEVAVAGVIHPIRGEIVRAWIILKPGTTLSSKDITHWCKDRIANYKVPSEIEFVSELPRTNVGKILRRELIRKFNER